MLTPLTSQRCSRRTFFGVTWSCVRREKRHFAKGGTDVGKGAVIPGEARDLLTVAGYQHTGSRSLVGCASSG